MNYLTVIQQKIITDAVALSKLVANYRLKNQRIVFTNGCFDLLHRGHVSYLAEAASLGHRLIVGVNADDSVRKLKGNTRPIQDEQSRILIVASLHVVSAVILFSEETPQHLIEIIKPDFLVKGGDWDTTQIVGADFVISYGGTVKSIPFTEGFSTSSIEAKIKLGA